MKKIWLSTNVAVLRKPAWTAFQATKGFVGVAQSHLEHLDFVGRELLEVGCSYQKGACLSTDFDCFINFAPWQGKKGTYVRHRITIGNNIGLWANSSLFRKINKSESIPSLNSPIHQAFWNCSGLYSIDLWFNSLNGFAGLIGCTVSQLFLNCSGLWWQFGLMVGGFNRPE